MPRQPSDDARKPDAVWRREEIESPCVKTCVLHPQAKICVGCFRSGEEIGRWSSMSPERRREVMAELPSRAARLSDPENRPSARRAARKAARDQG